MYVHKIVIKNIRSVSFFEMDFAPGLEAGWHVLLGSNGSGKSTIVRSIAAVLIGPDEIAQIRPYWEEWLKQNESEGSITLELTHDSRFDITGRTPPPTKTKIQNKFVLKQNDKKVILEANAKQKPSPRNFNWSHNRGWFSVAYGPFRRFTGGNSDWNKIYYSGPKAGAHLSLFGEDIALTEALEWLKELDRKRMKEKEIDGESESESETILGEVKRFLNHNNLLPYNTYFEDIDINGNPIFKDGNNNSIKVTQLSDGYRSILSLIFELLRQLIECYGKESVFQKDIPTINVPGIVLIDEIDAHLHPSWQTQIGEWFTKVFPCLQFIVTTHSPLVCRAAEKGSIWWLPPLGGNELPRKLTDIEVKRLVYGNILDAYATNAFGTNLTRSLSASEKVQRLAELNLRSIQGIISKDEEEERNELRLIFPSNK